mgnify:CR=1 FL=1
MHGNQVAENEYRAYRHENGPGGKPGFQTEQYRKYNGHTDERGIGCMVTSSWIHPNALDIWVAAGRKTPPLN